MGCQLSLPYPLSQLWGAWGLPSLEAGGGEQDTEVKQYSWDKLRVEVDLSQYIIDGQQGGEVVRRPGSIAGQQFQIKNCRGASIYLYDWANTVTVDDCADCRIFLGAVKSSVFLRDCSGVVLVAACGQLRLRDTVKATLFLCVASQPIIESSSGVVVGCAQYSYAGLPDQLEAAGLTPWTNYWSQVYDFSPVRGETNWKKAGRMFKVDDYLSVPADVEMVKELGISHDKDRSLIPLTTGLDGKGKILAEDSVCMITVTDSDSREGRAAAAELVQGLRGLGVAGGVDIVRTARLSVRREDAAQIFGEEGAARRAQGLLLALHLAGPGTGELDLAKLTSPALRPLVSITENMKQIQGLFGLVDIHRGF